MRVKLKDEMKARRGCTRLGDSMGGQGQQERPVMERYEWAVDTTGGLQGVSGRVCHMYMAGRAKVDTS